MRIIRVVLLFAMLIAKGADAISDEDKEKLAEMFSPILILTEETRKVYDETVPIRVMKPEPVRIISAQYADSIRFQARLQRNNLSEYAGGAFDWRSFANWEPPLVFPGVNFSQNRFAFPFRSYRYTGRPVIGGQRYDYGEYTLEAWFDYPGTTAAVWNAAYFGEGAYAGLDNNHRGSNYLNTNTAYVHIDSTTHTNYSGKLFVIQYHYFYPYNDWWNNHEGDWQRIDVVVSSSDPDDKTIEVLGVEYRFHGAWVTYYKNFPDHPGLTSSFRFNPQENLKLSQGTHPVVYVAAGSHAAYPVGGTIDLHDIDEGIYDSDSAGSGQGLGPDQEYMTHTGRVLSTQADDSHSDLWESYNLVLLPDPDPDNTNNMGLDPAMSWLGAQIRWGTPQVPGPGGNKSPERGPYNSYTNGWGSLNFDAVGELGPPLNKDPFHHDDLPYSNYHHWAIIGDEVWSGTISLTGDVVVFPGATLTIKPGTLIEVVTNKYDRHEFSLGDGKYYLTEIFVYGTLTAESPLPSMIATTADSILFQRNDPGGQPEEAWGGIHVMDGGTATLNSYTRISDTRRGKPTKLTAKVKDGQVGHIKLTWTNPKDRSIPQWEYQQKEGSADWGPWMSISGSTWSTSEHTVEGLTPGVSYQFKVRGLNRTGLAASDPSAAVTAAGPPDPPELTVAAGHERVRVRWSPGADNGSKIEQHEWRYRAGEAAWNPNWTVYATPEQIIRNLDNDTTYTFQMKAKNKVGYSKVVAVQATPRHPIQGPTAISVAENRDGSIASYRFAPAALDQSLVDYRLKLSDIADSGLFALDRQGGLHFRDAPDFEAPTDGDGDGVYTVWLKAAPGSDDEVPVRRTKPLLPFTKQVDVTVTDADEPGVIKLSSRSPEVRVPLTAVLTDPDGGIAGVRWQWQGQTPGATEWHTLLATSGAAQSRYTPQAAQVGWMLRAVATAYRDELGAGKRAESAATAPVAAGVLAVSFGASSYQAFEGGAAALVVVRLSPPVSQAVSIPIQVSADEGTEPGDYTVAGLNEGKVVFAAGESASSFTITANEDADRDHETVTLSFETSGVASASPEARVMLLDNDKADGTIALSSLSPQEGAQLTAEWTGPSSGITNPRWQWQRQSGPTSWINVAGVSSQPQPWVSIYIPQAGDVGYPLRATVRYTDGGGSNQRAESATTAAVRAATVEPEGPPLFSSDRVSYSVPAGSTDQQILPAAERAESYATVGTLPGYVAVNTTTRAITIRPENTHVGDAEFIWRARNPRGTDDLTVNITVTPLVETEYAYRASQTAPLFDASASGVPDHWSSGAITWTDAAPRVWRIGRTRPSGGSWSGWGPLKKYSERPAAAAIFYQRARRAPAPPATQTGITLATPSDWQTTPPPATDTEGVWTTTANRAQGAIPWLFTTPTQQTPPKIVQAPEPPRHFTAATGSPLTPGSIDLDWDSPTSGGTPTGYRVEYRFASGSWRLGATPTLTNASLVLSRADALYQFRVRAENRVGNSGWVEATGTTSQSVPTETAYRLHTSGTTAPSFTASASGVPSGWSSSRRTPNPHARYEWEISRTRPTGGAWSSWGSATVVSTYTERRTAYRLHTSGTTAPSFTASASSVPSGWSSSRQTPNPHARYEWEISRSRPAGGAWSSWGSASVVSRYTERRTAYRLHTSGTTAPSFTASASGVPSGWSSSRQTPNPHARYEWEISRSRPAGGSWSNWGGASVVSRYTEQQTAYKRNDSGTTAPAFSRTASGTPYGWSSSQPSPTSSNRYVWQISRSRPAGRAWSSWGGASVVSRYTEQQTAYKRNDSGTTAPAFSSTASGTPYGWSSSQPSPTSSNRYVWQISRSRPAGRAWSSWGSASVVARYTERQTAYKRNDSGTTAPAFSSTASGTPYGWSSSQPSPTSSNRYVWQISRSRPAGRAWSSWGSASVVARYTERQTAYKRNDSGTTAPAFSSTASGTPYGWSSSQPSPTSSNRYVWQISRSRPAGRAWSSWGSASVVSRYTERQTAYKRNDSGTTAPAFSSTASGTPYGWSSSQPSPTSSNRYVWRISRTRPAGGSWSSWGSATVISTYTERQTAFRLHTSGTTAPSFSVRASGVPSGWSSSRRTPNPHERYEWQISRTRPTGGSWSNWGSATVVSTYTARQTTYQWNTSGTTFPAATSGTDAESPTIKVQRRLAIAPEAPSVSSAASGFGIGTMAGCIGMPARRPKSAS